MGWSTWPPLDPFLTGYGIISTSGVSGIQCTWLLNDSSQYFLRVWMTSTNGSFTNPVFIGNSQTLTQSNAKRGFPLIAGDTPPAGLLNAGQVTVAQLQNSLNITLWQDTTLNFVMPITILRPGWSYYISDGTSATIDVINNAFYWDAVLPEQLTRPPQHPMGPRP